MGVSHEAGVSARGRLLSTVFHHQIHDLNEMLAYLPHPDTLPARVGTLEHHREQVRGEGGIPKSARLAQAEDALVLSKPVLLDDPSRRMVWIGQLGESVAKGGPALLHRPKLGGGAPAPILKLAVWISAVLGVEILPLLFFVRNDSAHPFRDQLILRVEVAVQRHLVRLRRLGDRFDTDAANALFMKQGTGRNENPLANRDRGPASFLRLQPVFVNICLHDSSYPSLTKMLPTGNIGVTTECYRSVT